MRRLSIILLAICCLSCSKQDETPKQFSSFDYRSDGSRLVPEIGIPQQVSFLTIGDTTQVKEFMPSVVVPIPNPKQYSYAYAERSSLYLGNDSNFEIISAIPDGKDFIQLLSDESNIYGIRSDGNIDAFDQSGKELWQHPSQGYIGIPSILAGKNLICCTDSEIIAIDLHTGKNNWLYRITIPAVSTIYDFKSKFIITALTFNNANSGDSILTFTNDGLLKSRCGFPGTRIISNICLCGKEMKNIAFGYIDKPKEADAERTLKFTIYSGIEDGHPKLIADHELPYLATNISSNGPTVLASGFEQSGNALESGIDAYYADDTTKLWQRRFTEPLAAPIAVNDRYAYFTLSFATNAEVPAKSIFYTLEISTGKTLTELPVTGVMNGAVTGMPMPIRESEFVLRNTSRSILYFLKP